MNAKPTPRGGRTDLRDLFAEALAGRRLLAEIVEPPASPGARAAAA